MSLYNKLQMINLKIKLENAVYALIQAKIREKLYDEDFRHESMIAQLEQTRVDNQLEQYMKPKKDMNKSITKIDNSKLSGIIKTEPSCSLKRSRLLPCQRHRSFS